MDRDDIPEALASYGVPLFADRPPPEWPRPELAELIRACLESRNPRFAESLIPVLLQADEAEARAALRSLSAELTGEHARWLRWLALATEYLAVIYGVQLRALLGREPSVPSGVFDRGDLPPPEADFGEEGLRALADELAAVESPAIDWVGSLEQPVDQLIERLWVERRWQRRHARAG